MTHEWYPRTVLFVSDVKASLIFYMDKLEFSEDWAHTEDGDVIVAQVSRNGFEIILNKDVARAGKGRVFISLYDEHIAPLQKVIKANGVPTKGISWGMPVTVVEDLDQNELFFSPLVSLEDQI